MVVGGASPSLTPNEYQTILTSEDSINWTNRISSSTHALKSVIWDGSKFVAIGYGGVIIASVDGTDWTENEPYLTVNFYKTARK